MPKLLRNLIAPVLALFLILVTLQILSANKTMKVRDEIFKACLDKGMDFSWSSESHGLTTEITAECVRN